MIIGILTGGGDVPPLNTVIFSAKNEASESNVELVGFINGWQGVLEKRSILLNDIKDFSHIGGTVLKSSRVNLLLEKDGVDRANSVLKDLNIEGLIIIGGDDTLSNAYYISEIPCVLISKTIDNDIGFISDSGNFDPACVKNYFTLGYLSAVSKIISYTSLEEGIRTTAFSHERIIILESMGMNSGWLALSSGLSDPDFIIIPEFPVDYDDLCSKIVAKYTSQKHVVIVISEGSTLSGVGYISADYKETDDFGHPRFGGNSYILRDMLQKDLSKYFDTRNINAVNPSYLYRSGKPDNLDFSVAQQMGKMAVEILLGEVTEPVLLATNYVDGKFRIELLPLSHFPKTDEGRFPKRFVNSHFYDPESYKFTSDGKKYLYPIVNSSFKKNQISNNREYYELH